MQIVKIIENNKTKQPHKLQLLFFTLFLIFCMLVFAIYPQTYIPTAKNGILLFTNNVLPSLFPFFIFTKLLIQLHVLEFDNLKTNACTYKIFGLPSSCLYIFILSILSGYPVSAKLIADLKNENKLSKDEVIRCLALCSTSGPVFILGTVGFTFFANPTAGFILLASHILASLTNGIVFRKFTVKNVKNDSKNSNLSQQICNKIKNSNQSTSILEAFSTSILESIRSILVVGGYIILFFIIIQILQNTYILYPLQQLLKTICNALHIPADYANALLSGTLELTRGCAELATLPNFHISLLCISALLGWSGISILMQSLHFLKNCKIKARHFLLVKSVQCILNILYCGLVLFIFC